MNMDTNQRPVVDQRGEECHSILRLLGDFSVLRTLCADQVREEGHRIPLDRPDTRLEVLLRQRVMQLSQIPICHEPVSLGISECVFGFPHVCKGFRSHREETGLETLEGSVEQPALVDETPKKMGEVDVEWVNEGPRFVPENYGLLLGERSTYSNLVTV